MSPRPALFGARYGMPLMINDPVFLACNPTRKYRVRASTPDELKRYTGRMRPGDRGVTIVVRGVDSDDPGYDQVYVSTSMPIDDTDAAAEAIFAAERVAAASNR